MPRLDPGAAPLEAAGDVHQAAEVAREHELRAGRLDRRHLVVDHLGRDLGVLDAEGAAEAAADLGVRELGELEALHAREQPAGLAPDPELAQARAGIVVGRAHRQLGRDRAHAQHVDEKADQLMGPRGEVARALAVRASRASNSSG